MYSINTVLNDKNNKRYSILVVWVTTHDPSSLITLWSEGSSPTACGSGTGWPATFVLEIPSPDRIPRWMNLGALFGASSQLWVN